MVNAAGIMFIKSESFGDGVFSADPEYALALRYAESEGAPALLALLLVDGMVF